MFFKILFITFIISFILFVIAFIFKNNILKIIFLSIAILSIVVIIPLVTDFAINNGVLGHSLVYSKSGPENWFSFMGSYIGAIATIILSTVSLWQNYRYKKLSDKITSLTLLPEIFLNSIKIAQGATEKNAAYYIFENPDNRGGEDRLYLFDFFVMNKHIIDLSFAKCSYTYYKDNVQYRSEEKHDFKPSLSKLDNFMPPGKSFSLIISLPKVTSNIKDPNKIPDKIKLMINFKYKNQYNMECSKEIYITFDEVLSCRTTSGNVNYQVENKQAHFI